jgi:protein O-mannosyl-transferase
LPPQSPDTPRESEGVSLRTQHLFLTLAILITIAVYLPHLADTFVDWDLVAYRDVLYSTEYVQTAARLFTDFQGRVVTGYYAPLCSVSLMLDKWLLGSATPSAWSTLLLNLLLHCLNGTLVFYLLLKLGAKPSTALLAAFIFLIHPVQVSSVMWFCQRKGLLAAAFYLAAYLAYLRHTDTRTLFPYVMALGLFVLALLTKPTVSVFPLALLVWRMLFTHASTSPHLEGLPPEPRILSRTWVSMLLRHTWSLLPFFLAALASGLVAMESERVSMEAETTPNLPLVDRPVIAAAAIWFYVGKVLLPLNLTPIYPRWDVDVSTAVWWLPLIGLAGAAVLTFRYRQKLGNVSMWCIFNFLIPLMPAIGLLKFGYLRLSYVADHFLYLSMVGMAGLVAQSYTQVRERLTPRARIWVMAAGCLFLTFCGVQTFRYGKVWQDSVSLWAYNLSHNPDSWTAHTYLGHALLSAGTPRQAEEHFQRTLDLKQLRIKELLKRSQELERSGDKARAQVERSKANQLSGTLASAHHNLGNALLFSQLHRQAMEQFRQAIALEPTMVKALTNLGVAAIAVGDLPDAVRSLTRAVELDPVNFEALYNLGFALRITGDKAGSERAFQRARGLRPDVPPPDFVEGADGSGPPR